MRAFFATFCFLAAAAVAPAQQVFPPPSSGGGGGASSVGLSMPSTFCTVSGSPVTSSGTLTCSLATGQTANLIFGTNASGNVGLMNLTAAQLPAALSSSTSINGTSIPASSTLVTSVGLSLPSSMFAVSNSPVTSSGTLTGAYATGQTANSIFGTDGSGNVGLRSLTTAQLPGSGATTVNGQTCTLGSTCTVPTGGTITSGTFASLPGSPSTGQLYLFTDSIYESAFWNGSSWSYLLRGRVMTPPSDGSFSWQNQGTSTDTTTNGGSNIVSPVGAGAHSMNGRYIAYPTAPFTITMAMRTKTFSTSSASSSNAFVGSSAGMYLSDGTKVLGFGINDTHGTASPTSTLLTYQSGATTAFNANIFVHSTTQGEVYWIRMDDGVTLSGNRTWWLSYDGTTWIKIYQESNTTYLTPTRIGFYTDAYDSGAQVNMWVAHWLNF